MIITKNNSFIIQVVLLLSVIVSSINGACVELTGSKSCPGFANFKIDTVNGLFPLASEPHYTDVATFDSYVLKYAKYLSKFFVKDIVGTCNKTELENYAASNLKSLTTLACNFILISPENSCQAENQKPKVCKTTCNEFVNSFQELAKKYDKCLNKAALTKALETHNSRCNKTGSNFNAVSNCVDSSNEAYCGFLTLAEAKKFCATSKEACCNSLGQTNVTPANPSNDAQKPASGNSGTSATSATSNKQANVDSASNSNKENGESSSGGHAKIWIIVGSVCAVLLIGAIIFFYKKGETLDNDNSYYEDNKYGYSSPMTEKKSFNNSSQSPYTANLTSPMNSFGSPAMKNNYGSIDNGDVLVNRNVGNTSLGGKIKEDDEFNFNNGDTNNYNFTSNVNPVNTNMNNANLYTGLGAAAAIGGAAAMGGAAIAAASNNEEEKEDPQPQMVNMTNIKRPETQAPPPLIKIDDEDEPQPQIVNMTNIAAPESQDRKSHVPEEKADEEPKAMMVNMTEIPQPEIQNRNTKYLSTFSEVPDNSQRISSQFYGDIDSYDFSSSKLNITSQLDNHLSVASSGMMSNRLSTASTDKELNSTPYRAIHTYEPQLNDELLLEMGDVVEVVYVYDDGWVWGINTRTNESGACPMLCLEKIEGSEDDGSSVDDKMKSNVSARESMISRDSVPGRRDSRRISKLSIK